MTERFNSTAASGESAPFSPAGEIILQLKADDPGAKIAVKARVDLAAEWETVATLDRVVPDNKFARLPKFPFLKLEIIRNTAGKLVSVRDDS
ncbi:hypothetical protein V1VFAS_030 [Rhizobium phage V1VFA-S]|nr:hypothetical protein V1VFAS_030 [Rhizobium phage V1VFA-S]